MYVFIELQRRDKPEKYAQKQKFDTRKHISGGYHFGSHIPTSFEAPLQPLSILL